MKQITEQVFYVGVNDHEVDLFEGQYVVPNGMSYNSYVIKDAKTCVMDTVDIRKAEEWLGKVEEVLGANMYSCPIFRNLFAFIPTSALPSPVSPLIRP